MRFRSTVLLSGKAATGLEVPADVVAALGSGKKPRVRVTVGGHTYRSTVAVMDGRFMLPLSAENRGKAGVAAGEEVDVDVEPDTAPREVELPADFAEALENEPAAKRFFEGISYSDKRFHVLGIGGAKKPETRRRRIDKAIARLKEGRAR
ncbi:hypothetical protein BAY59_22445 [Prauserella coralliicola]|nr:hypothetical protein BAY59_22445 [Prauserella coralliicola]